MVISQKCRTMVSNKPLGDVVLLLDGILAPGLPRYSSTMWRRSESVKCFDMITGFLTSPIPYTSVRKNGGLAFGKTWLGNFFVLVREVKNSRATTKKFSRHFFQRYCCPVKFGQLGSSIAISPKDCFYTQLPVLQLETVAQYPPSHIDQDRHKHWFDEERRASCDLSANLK